MDDRGMSEGSLAEGSKVEKDDDESSDDGTWEAGAEERLRKNNEDLRALNAKIGVLTRELFEICQTPIFTEEDACDIDEEVGGGVHEAPEVGGDEEAEVGRDCGFEQQGDGNAVDDPLGAYTEVRGEDKTAHEDEIVSRTDDNIVCIEIDDDGDEEEREVVPLVIPPLRSFVGDPSTTVDVDQLYRAVSVREIIVYRWCYLLVRCLCTLRKGCAVLLRGFILVHYTRTIFLLIIGNVHRIVMFGRFITITVICVAISLDLETLPQLTFCLCHLSTMIIGGVIQ
ncbi:uncharacterized protein HKW66_Vig0209920 [Vigna angularis]|uniref:Uncharacterized protein n=1 Tax=Phaseolus angularis TaxID=3914 RepID=A0A8T0JIY6_PHAAN|nr:uncharacterized protein HKW66_Vig0209920 [Vigna angularis]